MQAGIELISNNVGLIFEWIITLILLFGNILFFAKDFKIGLLANFGIFTLVFMWFYHAGYYWLPPLVLMLVSISLLSLSLIFVSKNNRGFI